MKKTWIGITIAVAVLSYSAAAEEESIALNPSPFAIMGPPYSHMSKDPAPLEKGEELLQLLELSGARWTRNDFWWGVVEPEPGQWEFDYFDQAIDSYCRHRIHLLLILCYGSAWNKVAPDSEEEMQQFGEYVYQMVNRYQYWVKHWEIWNEPNILPFWAPKPNVAHYTRLLQIAYQRAKEADPDCVILGGAMAGADHRFLRAMYEHGAKDHFDVLSYHTYGNHPTEAGQQAEINGLRAVMKQYGDDKPLWLTETGIYTGPAGVSLEQQAERVVRSEILWVSMGVERIVQLTLKDWTDDLQTRDATSFRGLAYAGGEAKPSFYAHRTLCDRFGDKQFRGRPSLHPELHCFVFAGSDQNVLVLWADEGQTVKTKLRCTAKALLQTDLYGNRKLLLSQNNKYELEIASAPVYLEGVGEDVLLAAGLDWLDVAPTAFGDRGRMTLQIRNPFDRPVELQLSFPDTETLAFQPTKHMLSVPAGGIVQEAIEFKSSPRAEPGVQTFPFLLASSIGGEQMLYGRIELANPYSIRFEPYTLLAIPEGQLSLTLANRSSGDVKGEVDFDFPESVQSGGGAQVQLAPGQEQSFPLTLDTETLPTGVELPLVASLAVGDLKTTAETTLRLLKAFQVQTPPKIDGSLEDWRAYPRNVSVDMLAEVDFNPNLKGGPEDISASGWLAWDNDNLYLALEVHDDHISLPESTVIWDFDSLQIAIDGQNDAATDETFDENDFEFEIALLRDDSLMVYATQYPEGHIASVVEQECEVAVVRQDEKDRMVYEIRIPTTVLPQLELTEGRVMGFNFILNDNDGPYPTDREGWLELTPGIGYGKEPVLYYDVILWP